MITDKQLPEAYKEGVADFYGREFRVSSDVLIPRPETEAAIDELLLLAGRPYLPGMKKPERQLPAVPLIVDVGTGSGCIAVTLKLEIPEANVIGLDVSEKALCVARKNAEKLGAKVDFAETDLLTEYDGGVPDIIVANLPYVDRNWEWLDKEALKHEPSLALYADNRGLALIFRLIDEVEKMTKSNRKQKWILLEADPCQHDEIITYAEKRSLVHRKTNGYWLVFRGC